MLNSRFMPTAFSNLFLLTIFVAQGFWATEARCQTKGDARPTTTLADLSGLAWIDDGRFIACHDAKVADENFRPRYAVLNLPTGLLGVTFRDAKFSVAGVFPNDLESIAKVPGKNTLLLCESGDTKNDPALQKIFKAKATKNGLRITEFVNWPVPITNVEATAVAQVGSKYIFVYAERADNQPSTEVSWLEFDPNRMEFDGEPQSVTFHQPNPQRYNRVIVGLDIDRDGIIYSVSAFDAEAAGLPDPDNGPYAAGIYAIGQVEEDASGPSIDLYDQPIELGTVDGLKVESVAIRENDGVREIYFGTDDENYGGVIRRLPAPGNITNN